MTGVLSKMKLKSAVEPADVIAAAKERRARQVRRPTGSRGVGEVVLDLSSADSLRRLWRSTQKLYGLVVSRGGSTQGAVLELKSPAGTISLRPGDSLLDVIDELELYRSTLSVTTGQVTIKLLQAEGATYTEDSEAGGVDGGTVQYTALQSSLLNIPSDTAPRTKGVPLSGGKGVRAIVSAPVGQTVTALTLVWWVREGAVGRWAEGPTQEVLSTGRRDIAGADQFVQVSSGEAWAEVRSSTASGAGNFDVTLVAN